MEYTVGGLSMRTDGDDVFECFSATASDRIPLDRLIVRVDKMGKTKLRLSLCMAPGPVPDEPIFGWGLQLQYLPRRNYLVEKSEEPGLREFFTSLGATCGRVADGSPGESQANPGTPQDAEPKRRKLFGRS